MNTLPATVGALARRGALTPVPVRVEIRNNLAAALARGENPFNDFPMFTHSVVPEFIRALLAEQDVVLLGLRGQGKSTLLRAIARLLDPYAPRLTGTPLPEHPGAPITPLGHELAANPDAPLTWLTPEERILEYIAVSDLTAADVFGESDPFRAQRLGVDLSDSRALQFGVVGAANHGIMIINELPDLSPKVQVALFDLLQEGYVQPAGATERFPLDTVLLFTANPEDYTRRGTIVTPLRDRIGSEIHTHYATDWRVAQVVTDRAANVSPALLQAIPPLQREYVERLAFVARQSPYVEPRSGVSHRVSIAALELLCTEMHIRSLHGLSGDELVVPYQALELLDPALTGRMELSFEGEELGSARVAQRIRRDTYLAIIADYFTENDLTAVTDYFEAGGSVQLQTNARVRECRAMLREVPGLPEAAQQLCIDARRNQQRSGSFERDSTTVCSDADIVSCAEFILESLVAVGVLEREHERYHAAASPPVTDLRGDGYVLN